MTADNGTDQGSNNGNLEKWLDSGCILKVEFIGFDRDWMC